MLNNSNLELDLDSLDAVTGGVAKYNTKSNTFASEDPKLKSKSITCKNCLTIIKYDGKLPSRCPECSALLSNADMS